MVILIAINIVSGQQHGYLSIMDREVSVAEARNRLTRLLKDVEAGGRVSVTRRGRRIAVLVSQREYARLRTSRPSPAEALRAWRARLPQDFEGFSETEVASLRDRSLGREVRLRR